MTQVFPVTLKYVQRDMYVRFTSPNTGTVVRDDDYPQKVGVCSNTWATWAFEFIENKYNSDWLKELE